MAPALSGLLDRARKLLGGFTLGQKVITALALIALVAGGLMFSSWVSKPTFAPLFSNLAGADASAIVDKLTSAGVPYQLADGGQTILVPKDKVYAARLQMSGEGLPASTTPGYSLLDKQSMTSSDLQQHTALKRALEGELTKTVQAIDGVQSAVVHLALPEKDVFSDDTQKTTASVLVATRAGKTLSTGQVQAVVHLVSSSVEGLSPDDVTVADSTGKVLSTAAGAGLVDATADLRSQQEQAVETRLEQSAQAMIDRVVGSGHSEVRVRADLDFDQHKTTSEQYTQPTQAPTLADTHTSETYSGTGTNAGGILGAGTNGVPTTMAGGANQYKKDSLTRNNAVDHQVQETNAAPGSVRRLTVAVLLDGRTTGTVDPATVSKLVSSAVGLDIKRGDAIQVGQMPFDTSAATDAKKQLEEARKDESHASMMSLVRTGGLLAILALVVLFSWLSARRRRKRKDGVEMDAHELTEMRRTVALQIEEERRRALEGTPGAIGELERGQDVPDPGRDVADLQDEIADMVDRQPDEVAQVLRGWLADRRS